ncbi:inositol/phosphatidylinositol phosphatase [Ephemerocybe angulata]|uniref:Inositol/phosphatidylinositol phosphatase n=1 Tax=Ephemerocybe angulata TaxID=980116 RepID=A0A8H6MEV7_9AGAR|nr:inositol/phosphatidylinositol phosphatase [Tulosesus angulatus]
MVPLFQRYNLYSDNDTYIFVPDGADARNLTIHRSSGDVFLQNPRTPIPSSARRSPKAIHGIVGVISLTLSEYIIVITGRELQSRLMGHDVYLATSFDILPLNPNVSVESPPHVVESNLLALVRSHFNHGNFLFSYTYDLTTRLQVQSQRAVEAEGQALWQLADDRFFWNRFLQTRLIDSASSSNEIDSWAPYILPILYGTFDLRPIFLHGRQLQLCLISRRCRYRAGTQQILLIEGPSGLTPGFNADSTYSSKFSFVQIRGSIPLFWSEINTLRYKPDLQIMELDNTQSVMEKHLKKQTSTYGPIVAVNLINQKGHEKPVKDAYERHIAQLALPDVKYEYFDFHMECKKMRWDRISLLIDNIREDLEEEGFFAVSSSAPPRFQKGVVRTNCMDNLDRTNVVQATIAKWVLNKQLIETGVLSPGSGVDDFEALSKDFREMWADHADAIATATQKGVLEDGVKSVTRYLKNTFFDGTKQDAFDLVTGAWIPRKNPATALFLVADTRPLIIRAMPATASFSLFMICAGLTLPRTSGTYLPPASTNPSHRTPLDYSLIYYFLLWFTVFAAAMAFIIIHGIQYVAWPRLNPLTEIIYYNGPGFRSANHGKGLQATAHLDVKRNKFITAGKLHKHAVEEVELGTLKKD